MNKIKSFKKNENLFVFTLRLLFPGLHALLYCINLVLSYRYHWFVVLIPMLSVVQINSNVADWWNRIIKTPSYQIYARMHNRYIRVIEGLVRIFVIKDWDKSGPDQITKCKENRCILWIFLKSKTSPTADKCLRT